MLSDADGDSQTRFQHFLDFNNPKIERSRANFDLTHMIKADGYYELPFGKGHRLAYGPLDRVIGGWILGGTMVWQSGAPFSILSGRGTLNREARSYYNTADTSLTRSQLAPVVKFQMTGNGPMIVSPIRPSTRPTAPASIPMAIRPSTARSSSIPAPARSACCSAASSTVRGPSTSTCSLKKTIPITEHKNVELRMDAFNALNHATFWSGDQNINSTTFGVISSMFFLPRIVQFGVHYTF